MVEPSGGCIALLHVQQHVGEASIKGPQRGASHGYTPCPEGCVPRALNTPLCTNLWHTHATCITVANFTVGDTGVDASLCQRCGAHMDHR